MPPLELIVQQTAHDCAICCLAMHTHWPYDMVLHTVGDAFDPEKGMGNVGLALERLGFDHKYENGEAVGDFVNTHRTWCLSPEFYRSMAWGRPALITVPSKNYATGWHMIYWDGAKVWDPSPKLQYADWKEVLPHEIVLFRHT